MPRRRAIDALTDQQLIEKILELDVTVTGNEYQHQEVNKTSLLWELSQSLVSRKILIEQKQQIILEKFIVNSKNPYEIRTKISNALKKLSSENNISEELQSFIKNILNNNNELTKAFNELLKLQRQHIYYQSIYKLLLEKMKMYELKNFSVGTFNEKYLIEESHSSDNDEGTFQKNIAALKKALEDSVVLSDLQKENEIYSERYQAIIDHYEALRELLKTQRKALPQRTKTLNELTDQQLLEKTLELDVRVTGNEDLENIGMPKTLIEKISQCLSPRAEYVKILQKEQIEKFIVNSENPDEISTKIFKVLKELSLENNISEELQSFIKNILNNNNELTKAFNELLKLQRQLIYYQSICRLLRDKQIMYELENLSIKEFNEKYLTRMSHLSNIDEEMFKKNVAALMKALEGSVEAEKHQKEDAIYDECYKKIIDQYEALKKLLITKENDNRNKAHIRALHAEVSYDSKKEEIEEAEKEYFDKIGFTGKKKKEKDTSSEVSSSNAPKNSSEKNIIGDNVKPNNITDEEYTYTIDPITKKPVKKKVAKEINPLTQEDVEKQLRTLQEYTVILPESDYFVNSPIPHEANQFPEYFVTDGTGNHKVFIESQKYWIEKLYEFYPNPLFPDNEGAVEEPKPMKVEIAAKDVTKLVVYTAAAAFILKKLVFKSKIKTVQNKLTQRQSVTLTRIKLKSSTHKKISSSKNLSRTKVTKGGLKLTGKNNSIGKHNTTPKVTSVKKGDNASSFRGRINGKSPAGRCSTNWAQSKHNSRFGGSGTPMLSNGSGGAGGPFTNGKY